ncbi:MAG: hypothetical protein CMI54_03165 [Parcubacteria group bacterium]|nr:hypothetical protein [Parcubacteria group bacterium]|tara:strand:- start:45680 stop:46480 length:801 start_codon:yes stop_codon:yes gene_type:complete
MLSIIIPTLNEEKYLPGLLKSLKDQSFKDFEVIVSDAGSKDKTIEIAENYGSKVVSGGLPAKGRNEGVKAAKGNLLLFLDADINLPNKNFLRDALKEFNKKNLSIASCRLMPFGKSEVLSKKQLEYLFEFTNYLMLMFEKTAPLGVGSMILIKKSIHNRIGGFNENVKLGEDHIYTKKAAKLAKFGILRSVRIGWSIRRFEQDKWIKPAFLYILNWLLIGLGEKKLEIFKNGFFEYRFDHYNDIELNKGNYKNFKKIKRLLKTKIL